MAMDKELLRSWRAEVQGELQLTVDESELGALLAGFLPRRRRIPILLIDEATPYDDPGILSRRRRWWGGSLLPDPRHRGHRARRVLLRNRRADLPDAPEPVIVVAGRRISRRGGEVAFILRGLERGSRSPACSRRRRGRFIARFLKGKRVGTER